MDAVELRARDRDAVEDGAVDAVDRDPVLAADDGDVLDRDVVRADDDAAADDRAGLADQHLAARDHERPPVDACLEVDDRRLERVGGAGRARERGPDRERRDDAEPAELAAVLGVAEPQEREARLAEDLREQPAAREERERLPERRRDRRARASARASAPSSASAERQRRPARLVGQQPVVDLRVEAEPDADHQRGRLDRPPAVQHERERAGRRRSAARRPRAATRPVPLSVYDMP